MKTLIALLSVALLVSVLITIQESQKVFKYRQSVGASGALNTRLKMENEELLANQERTEKELQALRNASKTMSNQVVTLTALANAQPPANNIPQSFAVVVPIITTNAIVGNYVSRAYLFSKLLGVDGNALATDARFERIGGSVITFKTSEGLRTYHIDDVHPSVFSFMGYDLNAIKRANQAESISAIATAQHHEWQMEMRNKAAIESANLAKANLANVQAETDVRRAAAAERSARANEDFAAAARSGALAPQVNQSQAIFIRQ